MKFEQSPVTGVLDESVVSIDFGKYEGKTVSEIAGLDPEYYSQLVEDKAEGALAIKKHGSDGYRLYVNPLAQLDH